MEVSLATFRTATFRKPKESIIDGVEVLRPICLTPDQPVVPPIVAPQKTIVNQSDKSDIRVASPQPSVFANEDKEIEIDEVEADVGGGVELLMTHNLKVRHLYH